MSAGNQRAAEQSERVSELSTPAAQVKPPIEGASPSVSGRVRPLGYVIAGVREFFGHCRRRPLWAICIGVFVCTWTIELYLVQGHTLVFPNDTGARYAFWAPKIRLALDFLFISALALLVRRRWLIFVVTGSFFVYLGLVTYFKYFQQPLSLLTILSNWREGLVVGGFALDMFPRTAALALLAATLIQLTALIVSRNSTLPARSAWVVGLLLLSGYLGLYAVSNYLDPLNAIRTTRGVGRLGHIRGYLGPWFAEWYYLRDDELLERAIANRSIVYDRITPLEADIPIHRRLVIVQAESLDTNLLGYKVNGVEVTPFLNGLRERSMFFRVQAIHTMGSSDADFVVLNGVRGSTHENTYSIPNYPYENTTPEILGKCGYRTYNYHGNSGEFYKRRSAYEQMGFTGLRFQEELVEKYDLKADRWGISDHDVLRVSAQELRTATEPLCHFVITLTTHTPYRQLNPAEFELYKNPAGTTEHYLNNMRYLDNCLRDYITSLGSGTTVLIYSDHPGEGFDGFTCDRDWTRNRQYIPCFIYDSDQDLSKVQKTRNDPCSTDGTWNLVDVANYLRAQIKRNCPPPEARKSAGSHQPESEHAPQTVR